MRRVGHAAHQPHMLRQKIVAHTVLSEYGSWACKGRQALSFLLTGVICRQGLSMVAGKQAQSSWWQASRHRQALSADRVQESGESRFE